MLFPNASWQAVPSSSAQVDPAADDHAEIWCTLLGNSTVSRRMVDLIALA